MRPTTRYANGYILYQGPSDLDASPIVAIATGIRTKSKNSKTGAVIQVWILRADMTPLQALAQGKDTAICGHCPSRSRASGGDGLCYVTVAQAPQAVYRAFLAGRYPPISGDAWRAFNRRAVRIGAYGDPAAVPVDIWRKLTSYAGSWTGYTHQWKTRGADLRAIVMASVDSDAEYMRAVADGWRTFRVRSAAQSLHSREITCPASEEAGYRTTCERCTLCAGQSKPAANVAILAHGAGAKVFALRPVSG